MNRRALIGAGTLALLGASLAIERLACDHRPSSERARRDHPPRAEMNAPARVERAERPTPDRPPAEPASEGAAEHIAPAPSAVAPPMPPTGHFAAMRHAFESESRDSSWAAEQEARIPQLLKEAGFTDEAFDREVICRRTLCRIVLRVDERSEADMFSLMKLASAVQTGGGLSLAYGDAEASGDKVQVVVLIPSERTELER